jgi:hypothetical protein
LALAKDFADGGIHLVKILGEDETLHQGDVRTACGVQRKALRENFEQTVVHDLRVLEHRGVRLEEDVDSGDRVRVGFNTHGLLL